MDELTRHIESVRHDDLLGRTIEDLNEEYHARFYGADSDANLDRLFALEREIAKRKANVLPRLDNLERRMRDLEYFLWWVGGVAAYGLFVGYYGKDAVIPWVRPVLGVWVAYLAFSTVKRWLRVRKYKR